MFTYLRKLAAYKQFLFGWIRPFLCVCVLNGLIDNLKSGQALNHMTLVVCLLKQPHQSLQMAKANLSALFADADSE